MELKDPFGSINLKVNLLQLPHSNRIMYWTLLMTSVPKIRTDLITSPIASDNSITMIKNLQRSISLFHTAHRRQTI